MRRRTGFTLVEVLFAIFIGLILMGVAYVAMNSGQRASAGMERKVAAQQDVRGAMQTIGLELSMASYNPNYLTGIWHDLPPIGNTVQCTPLGNQTYKGIREATPNSITVEMDLGESNFAGDERGEIIRYVYDTARQFVSRETANCGNSRGTGAALPFLGMSPASHKPRTVRVINNNLEAPPRNIVNGRNEVAVFRYYDGRNPANELYPHLNGDQIPDIRRIDITLAVETDEVDPNSHVRRQMTYSTSVFVRNHALGS